VRGWQSPSSAAIATARRGAERSWEVRVPWSGRRGEWVRVFRAAVPTWRVAQNGAEHGLAVVQE
jgi:hypothetical protein